MTDVLTDFIQAVGNRLPGGTQFAGVENLLFPSVEDLKNPTTEDVLQAMFVENTGRHICDSGGAYGRAWERNRISPPWEKPDAWVVFEHDYTDVTLSAYHFLKNQLEYAPGMDRAFHKFAEGRDGSWLEIQADFFDALGTFCEVAGPDGYGEPYGFNSCNEECLLDHTLQGTIFTVESDEPNFEDGSFILLQIHLGCDVRGGYSAPRVFRIVSDNDYDLLEYHRVSLRPVEPVVFNAEQTEMFEEDGGHYYGEDVVWDLEGSNWEYQGCSTPGDNLNQYEWLNLDEDDEAMEEYLQILASTHDPDEERAHAWAMLEMHHNHPNTLLVFDRQGYCPITGRKLYAHGWY